MNLTDYQNQIINTLHYKKIFTQPLTLHQILYFGHGEFDNLEFMKSALDNLVENKKIKIRDNKFYLSSTRIKNSDKRYRDAKREFDNLEYIIQKLNKIPFIKFVGVTGSLASYNFDKENEDVDLFIIVEDGRLWITRMFTVLIFKLLNSYVNDEKSEIKICPNIYLSSKNLTWSYDKRNIYVAHEIAMIQPLLNKEDMYFKFLKANEWVKEYLPNFKFEVNNFEEEKYTSVTFLDLLDNFLMSLQKKYMKKFSGIEVLDKNLIHFLKVDHSVRILNSFHQKIKSK